MRYGCSRFIPFLIAGALAPVAILPGYGQQSLPKRDQAAESSGPHTNVVSSTANKKKLSILNDNFKKPFDLFNPAEDSIGRTRFPSVPFRPPSAARSRRIKELLERRNDWIFLTPEEYLAPELMPEEMLDNPDFSENGAMGIKLTPVERYYERMDKARAGAQATATNQANADRTLNPFQTDEGAQKMYGLGFGDPQSPSSSGLSGGKQTTKPSSSANFSIFSSTPPAPPAQKSFSEIFGFGNAEPTEPVEAFSKKSPAVEARMQVLKQLLETGSPTTPNSSADAINPLASPSVSIPSVITLPVVTPAPADTFSGARSPIGSTPLTPSPSLSTPAANPSLPSWQTPPPAPAPPAMKLPPPTFSIPQRKFF